MNYEKIIDRTVKFYKHELSRNGLLEIRLIDSARRYTGLFNDPKKLIKAIFTTPNPPRTKIPFGDYPRNGECPGIYYTLNPPHRDCLSRACNTIVFAKETTSDANITALKMILIDCDSSKVAGVMASKEEKLCAWRLVHKVRNYLKSIHISHYIADSANGYHLLIPVNYPPEKSKETYQFLCFLKEKFKEIQGASIDTSVFNPSRICKFYGTKVKKGSHTEERPHRFSSIAFNNPVTEQNLFEILNEQQDFKEFIKEKQYEIEESSSYDEKFVTKHQKRCHVIRHVLNNAGINFREKTKDGSQFFELEHCPIHEPHDSDHQIFECCIIVRPNGSYAAKCQHDPGITWQDFKTVIKFDDLRPDKNEKKAEVAPISIDLNKDLSEKTVEIDVFGRLLKLPEMAFWECEECPQFDDNGKIIGSDLDVKWNSLLFHEFLDKGNLFQCEIYGVKKLIYIDKKIIYLFSEIDDIRPIILKYLVTLVKYESKTILIPSAFIKDKILNAYNKLVDSLRNPDFLADIHTSSITVNRDTLDCTHFYFRDMVLKVTRDGCTKISYDDLPNPVYSEMIIKHDSSIVQSNEGDFFKFVKNACNNNFDRTKALMSAIGYSINNCHDPSNPRAIVFFDETSSTGAEGGTGKSLIARSLEHVRKLVVLDGKRFDSENRFAFQSINVNTSIVLMDDLRRNFDLEPIFHCLTGGITVERKNKKEIKFPVDQSPKIILTTNYSVITTDNSSMRRISEYDISPFYGPKHSPVDDFGYIFFGPSMSLEEWGKFYAFMIGSSILYHKNGLILGNINHLDEKKFEDGTSEEFVEYCINNIKNNTFYPTLSILPDLLDKYPHLRDRGFSRYFTERKLHTWLILYARSTHTDFYKGRVRFTYSDGSKQRSCFALLTKKYDTKELENLPRAIRPGFEKENETKKDDNFNLESFL